MTGARQIQNLKYYFILLVSFSTSDYYGNGLFVRVQLDYRRKKRNCNEPNHRHYENVNSPK